MGLRGGPARQAGPGLNWSPWPSPSRNGLGPGRAAGHGLFGDPCIKLINMY